MSPTGATRLSLTVSTKPDPNLMRSITFKHGLVNTTFTQKLLPFLVKHALTQSGTQSTIFIEVTKPDTQHNFENFVHTHLIRL